MYKYTDLGAVHQRGQRAGHLGQLHEECSLFRGGLQQLHQEKVGAALPRHHQQYRLWSSGAVNLNIYCFYTVKTVVNSRGYLCWLVSLNVNEVHVNVNETHEADTTVCK